MTGSLSCRAWVWCCCALACVSAQAGTLHVGDLAPDFSLPRHDNGELVSLHDYEGSIVLLDFFAYWCPHCKTAASQLEPQIAEYYRQAGGNPSGIPVQLVPISVDNQNPTAVSQFAQTYGLEYVLDDPQANVYWSYGEGYVPHLAIINAAADANYPLWQILYTDTGYVSGQYQSLRSIIDSVILAQDLPFDFNADGFLDVLDIDLLINEILAGSHSQPYDVNGDALVNERDLQALVSDPDKLHTYLGDANLDREFNSQDLVQVLTAGKYEQAATAGWAEGDWNGDGHSSSADLIAAFVSGGYEAGPRADVATVPEPPAGVLTVLAIGLIWLRLQPVRRNRIGVGD